MLATDNPCNPRRTSTNGRGFLHALQVGVQLGMTWDCSDASSCLLASIIHLKQIRKDP